MSLLPRRRSSRHGRGQGRLAPVPGRDTQLSQLPAGSAVRFDFQGYSDIGVMPAGVVAIKDWGRDTQPLAWGRDRPEVTR